MVGASLGVGGDLPEIAVARLPPTGFSEGVDSGLASSSFVWE